MLRVYNRLNNGSVSLGSAVIPLGGSIVYGDAEISSTAFSVQLTELVNDGAVSVTYLSPACGCVPTYDPIASFDFRYGVAGAGASVTGTTWSRGGNQETTVWDGESRLVFVSAADHNKPRQGRRFSGHPMGYLSENETINLVLDGSNFSAASFTSSGGTVTRSAGIMGPGGRAEATLLSCPSGAYLEETTATVVGGGGVTASMWILEGSPNLSVNSSVAGRSATSGATGASWYRVSASKAAGNLETSSARPVDGTNQSGVGGLAAGSRLVTAAYLQRERDLIAKSYVPTSGGTATRPWDVCTIDNGPTLINQTSLVMEMQFCPLAAIGAYTTQNGSSSSQLFVYDNSNRINIITNDGSNKVRVTAGGAIFTTTTPITWGDSDIVTLRVASSSVMNTLIQYRLNSGPWVPLEYSGSPQTFAATSTASLMGNGSARFNSFINYANFYPAAQRLAWG